MTEKPILFSGSMVRAIIEGRKTMTRRVLKPQPNMLNGGLPLNDGRGSYSVEGGWKRIPYAVSDLLWVREAWQYAPQKYCSCPQGSEPAPCDAWSNGTGCASNRSGVVYRANGDLAPCWRPPIHMPRWASRITLRVTAVKVERLQSITKEDVIAEGITEREGMPLSGVVAGWHEPFAALWDTINGPGAWDANPWVAAYSFEMVKP